MLDRTLGMLTDLNAPAPTEGVGALVSLLSHIAAVHGGVDDDELAFLSRLVPDQDPDALREKAASVADEPLDLAGLRKAWPSVEDRYAGLSFAVRMAWKDGDVQDEERELLEQLRVGLELPEGAVDREVQAMAGQGGGASAGDLLSIVQSITWHAVELEDEAPESAALNALAGNAAGIARVLVDDQEVMGLYDSGVVAPFREGLTMLRWADIVTYSRVPTVAASIVLRTEDGATWTLVDRRLAGLSLVLDRLFAKDAPAKKPGSAPVVVQLRGETDDEDRG